MKRKLRIAQIAPLWVRIPPKKYGGIELIIYHLCNELVNRGHKVTLFASGDSKTRAKLVSVRPKPLLDDDIKWTNVSMTLLNSGVAYERQGQFDIIHAHNDINDLFFAALSKTPSVHTMHNPLHSSKNLDTRRIVLKHYHALNFVSISHSQAKLSDVKLHIIKNVYNGIDVPSFEFNPHPKNHVAWIARVDKYKGIENAIIAAKRAKENILLAGRLDYTQQDYFKKRIKPYLNGKSVSFIGEIGAPQKSKFFGSAKALLYPIEWPEPFGLVMTEAMACGTPVIGFDHGSVREVVKNGVTGFVVNTISEMVRAMKKIDTIDRKKCRAWVEQKFSVKAMVDGYEEVYERVLSKHRR